MSGDGVALDSFGQPLEAVVFGASGGIGAALVEALALSPQVAAVHAFSRSGRTFAHDRVRPGRFDLTDETSIGAAVETAFAGSAPALVIVATGLLHDGAQMQPEKSWQAQSRQAFERAFEVNTIGPALLARQVLDRLPRGQKSALALLSARVGSISDNRLGGWHAYRASKAALNMLIQTYAIELQRKNPTALCVGLHPGTVETPLSAPFRGSAASPRFTPDYSARRLLSVLDGLAPTDSGGVFAWDGTRVPA